ncbi:MAG TPA: SGNH/GDSL hydrolase family protein [Reyranella sp.]
MLFAMLATAIVTTVVMMGSAEVLARWLWPKYSDPTCLVPSRLGQIYRPNCVRRERVAEGEGEVVYRYNACGLRGEGPCAPETPTGVRIVLLGNSFFAGNRVNQPESLAEVVAAALRKQCAKGIDLLNLAVEDYLLFDQYFRLDAALKLHPSAVVLMVMPTDMFEPMSKQEWESRHDPNVVRKSRIPTTDESGMSLLVRARRALRKSRVLEMTQHYVFQNLPLYVRLYRAYTDAAFGDTSDYLLPTPPPGWQKRYDNARLILGEMAEKTRQAGSQLVLVAFPQRVQAALLEFNTDEARASATAFTRQMRAIAAASGVPYIDGLELIASEPHPSRLFYPVDGHLNVPSQRLVGEKLAAALKNVGIASGGDLCR